MKNVILIFLVFLIFSCAGAPAPDDPAAPPEPVETPAAEPPQEPLIPDVALTEPPPSQEPLFIEFFHEPMIEIAEIDLPVPFPVDINETAQAFDPALPEPPAPVFPPPAEEEPLAQQPPEPIQPPAPVDPAPAAAPTPTPSPSRRPAPDIEPRFPPAAQLGPAEEKPPVTARQPPAPSNQRSENRDSPPVQTRREPPAVSRVREAPAEAVNYSRTVRAVVGQIVEIPFRGASWVYLGELASRRGIVYDSRRLDQEGQVFAFRTEAAGTYSLKFYKQDFVRDYILNDHVQVIVGEAPETAGAGWFNPPFDRGRVIAEPRWPTALEEAEIQRRAASGSRPSTAAPPVYTPSAGESAAQQRSAPVQEASPPQQPLPSVTEPPAAAAVQTRERQPPGELLQRAQKTFDDGNTAEAIALLDQYREHYPSGSGVSGDDEVYWLYGRFYEADTPSRDILTALDYYRRLVQEYPQSGRYNDARRRIAYLERFYINIQ